MEILKSILIIILNSLVKNLVSELWNVVKKQIKKTTFTTDKRNKGGKN